jgi:hypothetical protein
MMGVLESRLSSSSSNARFHFRRVGITAAAAPGCCSLAGRPFAVSKLAGLPEYRFVDSAFVRGTYKQALADLAAKGHTSDVLDGQTLLTHAAAFESFDKRMAVLEARRDAAWEKVERRRSATKTISNSGT